MVSLTHYNSPKKVHAAFLAGQHMAKHDNALQLMGVEKVRWGPVYNE